MSPYTGINTLIDDRAKALRAFGGEALRKADKAAVRRLRGEIDRVQIADDHFRAALIESLACDIEMDRRKGNGDE